MRTPIDIAKKAFPLADGAALQRLVGMILDDREQRGWPVDLDSHCFVVDVTGCSAEQAEQVMRERLGPDESYGFDYEIGWGPLAG